MNVVLLYRGHLVCVSVCVSHKFTLKTGLENGLEMWRKKVPPSPVKCPSMSPDYRNKQYQDGNKMCEKSSACDRIRDKTDSNMKGKPFSYRARPCEPNSVMKVSSDSKGCLYLEKYILWHNPTLASGDIVDSRTCFLCTGSSLKHNLDLMWLA